MNVSRRVMLIKQPIPPGYFRQFILILPGSREQFTVTDGQGVVFEVCSSFDVEFPLHPLTMQAKMWRDGTMAAICDELRDLAQK